MSDEKANPPGNTIHLNDVWREAAKDPLTLMRGAAVQAYANLEQSLCLLFAQTGNMDGAVAGIIFWKITSTQARNAILEKLIRKKHGNAYNLFWNAYLKELRQIDLTRNAIVHWAAANNVAFTDTPGGFTVNVTLIPPNFWDLAEEKPSIDAGDLRKFMDKCNLYSRAASMFLLATNGQMPPDKARPWLDIFQQPLADPLPDTHPLHRNYKAPDTPPPASPGSP